MVDLFAVNDFVRFLKHEYPEISVSVTYCPVHFELKIEFYHKNADYHYRTIRKFIYDTKEALGAVNSYFIDFLASLSIMRMPYGVKMRNCESEK